jgi:hypothetical protein
LACSLTQGRPESLFFSGKAARRHHADHGKAAAVEIEQLADHATAAETALPQSIRSRPRLPARGFSFW